MTHLVVIKAPARRLNPNRHPISIQPGVVIACDSRLTNADGRVVADNAKKCFELGNWCLAAYSGDVSLAEMAVIFTNEACRENNKLDDYWYTLRALTTHLRLRAKALRQRTGDTVVILAGRLEVGAFKLHRLASAENFEPKERDGVVIEGSGANALSDQFIDAEIDNWARGKSQPVRSGYKLIQHNGQWQVVQRMPADHEPVTLLDVAVLAGIFVDDVVQKAGIKSVGGNPYVVILSNDGINFPQGVARMGPNNWRKITSDWSPTPHGTLYYGPLLDGDCKVVADVMLKKMDG